MADSYQQNNESLTVLAMSGSPAERLARGFVCGIFLGVALALVCGCFVPCVLRS